MEAEFDNIDTNEGGMILFKVKTHKNKVCQQIFKIILKRNFPIGLFQRILIWKMILIVRKMESE